MINLFSGKNGKLVIMGSQPSNCYKESVVVPYMTKYHIEYSEASFMTGDDGA